jgi:peroxiredoxin
MGLKIGDKAPDFTLFNSNRESVGLDDFKGRNVVLLFFPLAFTSTCTKELCSVRDEIGIYQELSADVLGISVDTPMTLAKYKAEQHYPFQLLSDFNKDVSRSYGSLYAEFILGMRGVSKRSAFVIDINGTIQYAEVLENAGDLPNFVSLKQTLSKLNA